MFVPEFQFAKNLFKITESYENFLVDFFWKLVLPEFRREMSDLMEPWDLRGSSWLLHSVFKKQR